MKKIILFLLVNFLVCISYAQESKEYYSNGNLKSSGKYDSNGKRTGKWKFYKVNGDIDGLFYYMDKNTTAIINFNDSEERDVFVDNFGKYIFTDSVNEANNYKFELKNNTGSKIKLGSYRFRCPSPEICKLNETFEGKIIESGKSVFFEFNFKNVENKPGFMLFNFEFKGTEYRQTLSFK